MITKELGFIPYIARSIVGIQTLQQHNHIPSTNSTTGPVKFLLPPNK